VPSFPSLLPPRANTKATAAAATAAAAAAATSTQQQHLPTAATSTTKATAEILVYKLEKQIDGREKGWKGGRGYRKWVELGW